MFNAVIIKEFPAFHAQHGLQASLRIINSGMNNLTVPAAGFPAE
jgi:hypothetical protein